MLVAPVVPRPLPWRNPMSPYLRIPRRHRGLIGVDAGALADWPVVLVDDDGPLRIRREAEQR